MKKQNIVLRSPTHRKKNIPGSSDNDFPGGENHHLLYWKSERSPGVGKQKEINKAHYALRSRRSGGR